VSAEAARRRVSVRQPQSTPEKKRDIKAQTTPVSLKVEEESSSEEKDGTGPRTDEDDLFDNVTGEYDKMVEYDAATYAPARLALENGNLTAFVEAVAKMPGVNMQDPEDQDNSLLHWAAAYNRVDMVKVLLRRGARNLANNVGKTPLEIAKEAYKSGDSSYFELHNLLVAGLR